MRKLRWEGNDGLLERFHPVEDKENIGTWKYSCILIQPTFLLRFWFGNAQQTPEPEQVLDMKEIVKITSLKETEQILEDIVQWENYLSYPDIKTLNTLAH